MNTPTRTQHALRYLAQCVLAIAIPSAGVSAVFLAWSALTPAPVVATQNLSTALANTGYAATTAQAGTMLPAQVTKLAGIDVAATTFTTDRASSGNEASTSSRGLLSAADKIRVDQVNRQIDAVVTKTIVGATTGSNGSSGVGATRTWSATGVIAPDIFDGVTLVLGSRVLIPIGLVEAGYEGAYTVTTLGATGVSQVVTRDVSADTAAEILYMRWNVLGGIRERGNTWGCTQAPGTINGSTMLGIVPIGKGDPTVVSEYWEDFTRMSTATTVTTGTFNWGDLGWTTSVAGASSTISQPNTNNDDQVNGNWEFTVGTAAVGDVVAFNPASVWRLGDTTTEARGRCRIKVPVIPVAVTSAFDSGCNWTSSGTFGTMVDGYSTYVRGTDAHPVFVMCGTSVCTTTDLTSAAITAATLYQFDWIREAGTSTVNVWLNQVLLGANLTGTPPSGSARMFIDLESKASTTGVAVNRRTIFDGVGVRHVNPKGRAAI